MSGTFAAGTVLACHTSLVTLLVMSRFCSGSRRFPMRWSPMWWAPVSCQVSNSSRRESPSPGWPFSLLVPFLSQPLIKSSLSFPLFYSVLFLMSRSWFWMPMVTEFALETGPPVNCGCSTLSSFLRTLPAPSTLFSLTSMRFLLLVATRFGKLGGEPLTSCGAECPEPLLR